MIVDLGVVGDHVAAVGRAHRLVAGRRQLDDRQAAVAEPDSGLRIDPHPLIVRAAMGDRIDQPPDIALVEPRCGDDAGDPAHLTFGPFFSGLLLRCRVRNQAAKPYGKAAMSGGTNWRRASTENSRSAL